MVIFINCPCCYILAFPKINGKHTYAEFSFVTKTMSKLYNNYLILIILYLFVAFHTFRGLTFSHNLAKTTKW